MKQIAHAPWAVVLAAVILTTTVMAEVPQGVYYQGRLTDPAGVPVDDGSFLVKLIIYDADVGGTELWNSQFQTIQVVNGVFGVHLGAPPMDPLPWNLFADDSTRYLGITVGVDPEITPRVKFTSAAYAYHARTADNATQAQTVVRSRDLYHNIMDIGPSGEIMVPFIAADATVTATLYLYGSEFQAGLQSHTHSGNNAHDHTLTGTVASKSVSHNHSFSASTSQSGSAHTHSGTTGNYNLSHNHTGNTGYYNLYHRHGGTTNLDAAHHHNFVFTGISDGSFLTHAGNINGLDAHGVVQQRTATGSVSTANSKHQHAFNTGYWGGDHRHTMNTSYWGGNHSHTFTSGSGSSNHGHTVSGTTGNHSVSHNHSFSGSVGSFGTGLTSAGTAPVATPTNVMVYVDGSPAVGPFSGTFATGALDLSGYVTGAGEHTIEIREEGGTGGRITYNLFVE